MGLLDAALNSIKCEASPLISDNKYYIFFNKIVYLIYFKYV